MCFRYFDPAVHQLADISDHIESSIQIGFDRISNRRYRYQILNLECALDTSILNIYLFLCWKCIYCLLDSPTQRQRTCRTPWKYLPPDRAQDDVSQPQLADKPSWRDRQHEPANGHFSIRQRTSISSGKHLPTWKPESTCLWSSVSECSTVLKCRNVR